MTKSNTSEDSKTNLLSFTNPGRPYRQDEIPLIFLEIKAQCDAEAEVKALAKSHEAEPKYIDSSKFAEVVAKNSGSHLLKSRKADFGGSTAVLRLTPRASNRMDCFLPSINAADIKCAKILYRPIEVEGHARIAGLVDHIVEPDAISEEIYASFASAYGVDVLQEVKDALLSEGEFCSTLPATEFPIIFVPGPCGDIQITPIHPARAFIRMRDIRRPFFEKRAKGDDRPRPRGSFSVQAVSSQLQNVSGAYTGGRVRFHAEFPETLTMQRAQVYRFAMGGRQPSIAEDGISDRLESYIALMESWSKHHSPEIEASMTRLAKAILRIATEIAGEIIEEAKSIKPDIEGQIDIPSLILSTYRTDKNPEGEYRRNRARSALRDRHFRKIMETFT